MADSAKISKFYWVRESYSNLFNSQIEDMDDVDSIELCNSWCFEKTNQNI